MGKKIMVCLALVVFGLFIVNLTILVAEAQSYAVGVPRGSGRKNMMEMMGGDEDHKSCLNFTNCEGTGMMEMHSNFEVQHAEHCSRKNIIP